MKPFTNIATAIFALIAIMHLIRLILGWEVTVNAVIIPMWVGVLGLIVAVGLAWLLWLENRRPQ
jgi:hypothetical protein